MTETEIESRVAAYWHERGYVINTRIEGEGQSRGVRSDMWNGLPRGYRDINGMQIGVAA